MIILILTEYVVIKNNKIKIDELPNNSHAKIEVVCPQCMKIRTTEYRQIIKNNHHLCKKCVHLNLRNEMPIDLKFGKWTTISSSEFVGKTLCRCDCGTLRDVDNYSLINGESSSCGCDTSYNKDRRISVNVGDVYNRLMVVNLIGDFECECSCKCGGSIITKNTRLVNGLVKSCGCLQKEIASNNISKINTFFIKENHPNWKGDISGDREVFMQTSEYKAFRFEVYKRDDYECQKCGCNHSLNAHHVIPYAENTELRTKVDNGITFCEECHREFHKIYGRKNIGQKEIDEYIMPLEKKEVIK